MPKVEIDKQDYVIRVHSSPASVDAPDWDALLEQQAAPTPFMRHAYLLAMHESASAVPDTGWAPQFITLTDAQGLQAACALYLKSHSYGEYVFDWSWADAYQRHGLRYYPKLLGAAPFTPVPGARLLATASLWRQRLAAAIGAFADQAQLSSAHLLFTDDEDSAAMQKQGWMLRHGVQFHWLQDAAEPMAEFADLLARMQREKRKKIMQERRKVAEAGVEFTAYEGRAITPELWNFFYRCYTLTYAAHHSTPYLTRDFFARIAQHMPENWLMFVARSKDASNPLLAAPLAEPLAASLIAIDPQRKQAWGRYWGATTYVPCLHFEACYYQPLAWCLANGYQRFEGGAQGEHKMARGLLPVRTNSVHWLRDERFADAVADFLAGEGQGINQYVDELRERNPFKDSKDA